MYQQRPQQPDLDQILQQLKGMFSRIFGRLGGGGVSAVVILVLMAGIGLWLFSGVYRIQANEQGVIRLFGARASVQDPGLGWRLPSPLTSLVKVDVEQIRTAEIGFRTDPQGLVSRLLDEALMLTTDNSIVEAQLVIQYRIGDPEAFVYNVTDPEGVLHTTAEVALRSIVGRTQLDDFLTVGRATAELETRAFLEELLTAYGTGIVLTDVKLQTVDPPDQVKDAFQEVVRALEDETRLENEGKAYAADRIPRARGQVQVLIQAAAGFHRQQVERATGEANRFLALLQEYRQAPQVTRERLYLETLEVVLGTVDKTLIDSNVNVLPLLDLAILAGLDEGN